MSETDTYTEIPVSPTKEEPFTCLNCEESQELMGELNHQNAALVEIILDKRVYHLVQEFISALRSKVHAGKCKHCRAEGRDKWPLLADLATVEELARATVRKQ